jgi:phosphonate transport system substrate-binding protein
MRKLLIYFRSGFYLALVLLTFGQAMAATAAVQTYSIFVVPQLTPVAIHKAWTPILEKLGAATGLAFELTVEPSIPAFEEALVSGTPDFAFMNPYHCIIAKRHKGYIPLLRDSANMLEGILVVRKDSPVNSLEELNGQTVSFPAPNSFAASLFIRAQLAKKHVNIIPNYVKTHSNVYRSVLLGDAAAGGGVNNTFQREPADVRDQLRILYVTPQSAPHALAANPRIPKAVRAKVIASFIKLATDPANAALFDAIQMPKPVQADYSRDYKPLEALGLDEFAVTGSE